MPAPALHHGAAAFLHIFGAHLAVAGSRTLMFQRQTIRKRQRIAIVYQGFIIADHRGIDARYIARQGLGAGQQFLCRHQFRYQSGAINAVTGPSPA